MPDDRYDDIDESDEEEDSGLLRKLRKQVKEQGAAAESLAAENAALKREGAFRTAGIDPSDPKARYFVKGYDGEITVEAIKAEAAEAGLIGSPDSDIPADERASQDAAARLAAGAPSPAAQDEYAQGLAELNAATTQEEVLEVAAKYGVRIKNPLDE